MTDGINKFLDNVEKTNTCWLWIANRTSAGYGNFYYRGNQWLAHRFSYENSFGCIPDGLQLHHICRNKLCVNPEHLIAMTQRENLLQDSNTIAFINSSKTLCKNGHELTANNLTLSGLRQKERRCKICFNNWNRRYLRQRRK